jgi:hypothetical protein
MRAKTKKVYSLLQPVAGYCRLLQAIQGNYSLFQHPPSKTGKASPSYG